MDWHRILSALLAAMYVILRCQSGGIGQGVIVLAKCVIPLVCIWWPEELGQYVGPFRRQGMNWARPAGLVRFGGWVLLSMPIWLSILIWLIRPLCDYNRR